MSAENMAGNVIKFKLVQDKGRRTSACAHCGYGAYGKALCRQCWSGGMAYRHNRAALHFMRMGARS